MRTKLITTVVILWVAAVGGAVAYYAANRTTINEPTTRTDRIIHAERGLVPGTYWDTSALWTTVGIITAIAIVALLVINVWAKDQKATES